jgi:hypothetical protein
MKETAMAAFEAGRPDTASRAADLAAEPDAMRWAELCAWVPGTGHCRRRDCNPDCTFRAQREAESRSVARWRRLRRIFSRPPVR